MGFPVSNPIDLRQVASTVAVPASGTTTLFVKTDGRLYTKIPTGHEFSMVGTLTAQYTTDPAPGATGNAHRNICIVTAQATAAAFPAPAGTLVDGNTLIFRIKDNGTARALTWDAVFRAFDAVNMPLPTTTTAGKWLYLGFQYNGIDFKWDLIALVTQS